jgi:inosine-uridine nucleoside N-ribohydrolase
MILSRRAILGSAVVLCGAGLLPRSVAAAGLPARMRVIVDNDLGGDPDGLFALAHALRSPSAKVRLIVGSHLHATGDFVPDDGRQAARAVDKANELLGVMGLAGTVPVVRGAEGALGRKDRRASDEAVAAIVREAMREDTTQPLFYCAGAGLTDLAAAWKAEPRIGRRLTLVWIGGGEHAGLALPPPGAAPGEYNLTIDTGAAQVVFGESDIPIWQVPRNAYRQMMVSEAELQDFARSGKLAGWLVGEVERVRAEVARLGLNPGETYILGDSPLVLLTALQSSFEADPASSGFVVMPTPRIGAGGTYVKRGDGRPMRAYTRMDTRLTFADMALKLRG